MRSHRFTAIVRLLIQVDVREGPKTVAGSDALTISTTKPPHKAEALSRMAFADLERSPAVGRTEGGE